MNRRRSIRLPGHDYSGSGTYFVTVCTFQRQCLFGEALDGAMQLSEAGQIVAQEWLRTAKIRPNCLLDNWIVMPNHFHAIVVIQSQNPSPLVGAHSRAPLPSPPAIRKARSLSSLVAGFKSAVTKQVNLNRNRPNTPLWQRNYYEHIVRNDASLERLRQYILDNPRVWERDQLHPKNPSKW